jgi:hypothetical protein
MNVQRSQSPQARSHAAEITPRQWGASRLFPRCGASGRGGLRQWGCLGTELAVLFPSPVDARDAAREQLAQLAAALPAVGRERETAPDAQGRVEVGGGVFPVRCQRSSSMRQTWRSRVLGNVSGSPRGVPSSVTLHAAGSPTEVAAVGGPSSRTFAEFFAALDTNAETS